MNLDARQCYEILKARDARYDGVFFVAVSSTRVYCRPICTVRMPRADRCSFYAHAASAEQAGYRPCLRCRPELAPGAASVDAVRRVAQRAADRIAAGALTGSSVDALAAELGLGARQLRRAVEREYGVPPIALAQTQRLLLAKQLLTDTSLKVADVAFASGFGSLRRFNHAFRTQYRLNPASLRQRRRAQPESDGIRLRLAYRPPLAWESMTRFLTGRSVPRLERLEGGRYLRTVRLGAHCGWIAAEPVPGRHQLLVKVAPRLLPVLTQLLAGLRRLFDLDANPGIIEAHLMQDARLALQVSATPGLRVPGAIDGFELALRAVLGQQVSVKAATTIFGRFVDCFGDPVQTPFDGMDRLCPTAQTLAGAELQQLIDRGITRQRAETVRGLARAIADGRVSLQPGGDWLQTVQALQQLPGIGPWTAHYIAMRALSAPDAFPHADLALLKAMGVKQSTELLQLSEAWRPWRAYAALHLWTSLSAGG